MKLTIGGSPCTHWSIAKKQGRETEPEGQGWELFQNYKIALVKFRPDYFLYENNNSISAAIKERITLISIHALREERDHGQAGAKRHDWGFQSTRSARSATV